MIGIDERQGVLTVSVNNRFEVGDRLELMSPAGNCAFVLETLMSESGAPREAAPGSGHVVKFPIPQPAARLAESAPYAMLARYF